MAPPKTITKPVPAAEAERRLRPALDVLYSSDNPRPALKLATQAEAKRPGWPAARAVRAIALRRLGRVAEAEAVAAAVLSDLQTGAAPADEDSAAKLHLYYRETPRREAETAAAYEAVARACDGDPFLAEGSFYWHLRARDWAGAQRVATRLQRTSTNRPKEEYAVWTAAAVWLGNGGGGVAGVSGGNPKMGALAAAMVKRAVSSGNSAAPPADVARFVTRLLCDVGAHADAAAVMARGGIVMDASEAAHICADIAFQSGNVRMAREMYQALLVGGDADDWAHWLRYIDLYDGSDEGWEAVEKLVEVLCSKARDASRPARGPFLADMEVRLRQKDWAGLRAALFPYFARFGGKPVCSHDMRPYALALAAAEPASGARLIAELEEESGKDIAGARHLHLAWLRLWLDCLDESIDGLRARYEAMLVENLESTERQPGDDYILLAVHKLLPSVVSDSTGNNRYANYDRVLEAICLVGTALARSPFNFHFKLLAIRLYNAIGAAELAFKVWRTLEIKHVQTATLSHLVSGPMFEHGVHVDFASTLTRDFDKLWLECTRDVPESVSRAFAEGMVNAGVEFLEFRDRLERSSSLVQGMLYDSLVKLNLAHGETLGLERAWSVVGDEGRFLPQDLAVTGELYRPVIANEDEQCMEFWDIHLYDARRSRADMDAPGADAGKPMVADEQAVLLIDILATRCVVQHAVRETQVHQMKDTLNLLQATYASLSDSEKIANPRAGYLHALLLSKESHTVSSYLADELAALTATAINGALAPWALGRAGRLVYQTLTLTSLALARATPGARATKYTRAHYKAAATTACEELEPLVAARLAACEAPQDDNKARHDVTVALATSAQRLLASLRAVQTRLKMMA